jgi:hypothetical protein
MIRKHLLFCIQGHFLLSISAFIFSLGILDGNKKSFWYSFAIALAVFGVYNFNRLNKFKKNQLLSELNIWYEQNSILLRNLSIICLFSSSIIYMFLLGRQLNSLILMGITGLISLLYIYNLKKINIRQIPGTKALWISIVWTLISVVIPKLTLNLFVWSDLHYLILFLALTIPGDIRDCDFDSHKMRTIPQILGKKNAALLFYLLITVFLIMNFLFTHLHIIGGSVVLFQLPILVLKNTPMRYELMDGLLLILGIGYLIG